MFADFLVDRERELVETARDEGRDEGLNKKAREVAGNLKGDFDDEFICDVTGLSLEEVKKIQKSNK